MAFTMGCKGVSIGMQSLWELQVSNLSVISNIFVGQTEAPLVIKPFLDKLTRSELMAIMTGGMATIAGGVMAAAGRLDNHLRQPMV